MGRDTLEQLSLFNFEKDLKLKQNGKTQKCKTCKQELPLTSFNTVGRTHQNSDHWYLDRNCKRCDSIERGERITRVKKYGQPPKDYKCPICLRNEEELQTKQTVVDIETYKVTEHRMKRKNVWRLDHDHNTGKVRGWICNSCNISMGQLDDDIDTLKRAVNYLEENNGKG